MMVIRSLAAFLTLAMMVPAATSPVAADEMLRLSAGAWTAAAADEADGPVDLFAYDGAPVGSLGLAPQDGLGVVLSVSENLRIGTTALAPASSSLPGDSDTFRGFESEGGEVGAFAEYSLDDFKVTATARQNLGDSAGAEVEVGFGYGAKLSPEVSLSVGPTFSWSSGGRRDGVFGIDTGVPARRDLDSAFDVGASVVVNWHFLDNWSLSGVAGAKQLLGEAADAAALLPNGSATEFFTGFSFGYRF